mmetsp:Transcript_48310/g.134287  ORF Transcript_48310/g.134287 Transcript_48310/m.134287 type:complete len:237 (-) Transcript_48310:499-1209(-)
MMRVFWRSPMPKVLKQSRGTSQSCLPRKSTSASILLSRNAAVSALVEDASSRTLKVNCGSLPSMLQRPISTRCQRTKAGCRRGTPFMRSGMSNASLLRYKQGASRDSSKRSGCGSSATSDTRRQKRCGWCLGPMRQGLPAETLLTMLLCHLARNSMSTAALCTHSSTTSMAPSGGPSSPTSQSPVSFVSSRRQYSSHCSGGGADGTSSSWKTIGAQPASSSISSPSCRPEGSSQAR